VTAPRHAVAGSSQGRAFGEVLMHSVAVLTDAHPSDAGTTSPCGLPGHPADAVGAFRHRSTDYRVHVHVVPASSPEVAAVRGFRDALRADPLLRRRYAALKQAIVEGGPVDPVAFTKAKHDWIVATLGQLGLGSHQHDRLYEVLQAGRTVAAVP
jgi:GrpB protein